MTSFDVKKKRPWWLSWIPATILLVIVIGVGVTSAVLLNNGLGKPQPKPTVGQVTELNWSSFTTDGLAYIERSRNVRIDLSHAPASAADVGLPADGATAIGPSDSFDTDNDYYLIVSGGGEGHGGHKFTVSELTVTTADGVIESIHAVASGALPFRLALKTIQDQADEFGWPPPDTTSVFAQVEDATRAGQPYEVASEAGSRLGITVSVTASCDTSGYCLLGYDVTPQVR